MGQELDIILGQNRTNGHSFRASFAGQETTKLYYLAKQLTTQKPKRELRSSIPLLAFLASRPGNPFPHPQPRLLRRVLGTAIISLVRREPGRGVMDSCTDMNLVLKSCILFSTPQHKIRTGSLRCAQAADMFFMKYSDKFHYMDFDNKSMIKKIS
jgi:hypothetical protein